MADVYGGSELRSSGDTYCTTAFTVKNSNNVKGALSAKHCGTGNTFRDWLEQVTDNSPVYKGQHYGEWGDMRWLTTSHNEWDDYYWNNDGDRRDVEYVKNNDSIGDPVAAYGRGDDENHENHNGPNGWTGSVKFIRVGWGSLDRMVCIGWYGSAGGDSGGPYFNGTVAVGITFGGLWKDGKYRDCFSQTRYVDNALGVTIFKQASIRTLWPAPPSGSGASAPGVATSRRYSRLPDGRWHAPASVPVGAASTTPAPAAGPRRTSAAATAAAVRASPIASGARPTTRSDGRRPGGGWRSGRSRPTSRSRAGAAPAGVASHIPSDPESSPLTMRCRSSSVASHCRHAPACTARAATRARG